MTEHSLFGQAHSVFCVDLRINPGLSGSSIAKKQKRLNNAW
jgi:hypothetical protein